MEISGEEAVWMEASVSIKTERKCVQINRSVAKED